MVRGRFIFMCVSLIVITGTGMLHFSVSCFPKSQLAAAYSIEANSLGFLTTLATAFPNIK
jgi:hypothetical protein